jgi:hypothetical protein
MTDWIVSRKGQIMKRTTLTLTFLLLATPALAQSGWYDFVPPTPEQVQAQRAARERLYKLYPDWGCHPGIDCCNDNRWNHGRGGCPSPVKTEK